MWYTCIITIPSLFYMLDRENMKENKKFFTSLDINIANTLDSALGETECKSKTPASCIFDGC